MKPGLGTQIYLRTSLGVIIFISNIKVAFTSLPGNVLVEGVAIVAVDVVVAAVVIVAVVVEGTKKRK